MELEDYGFEEVGEWKLYNKINSGISFDILKSENERVIYAFVVDSEAKYLGICEKDDTTFRVRLRRYKYLLGAGTNERIAKKIKGCLEENKKVKIYALKPESELRYEGLKIDIVKGLENPLIREFNPDWNIRK